MDPDGTPLPAPRVSIGPQPGDEHIHIELVEHEGLRGGEPAVVQISDNEFSMTLPQAVCDATDEHSLRWFFRRAKESTTDPTVVVDLKGRRPKGDRP